MARSILVILMALLTLNIAFAANENKKEEKDKSVALRGEGELGGGYKVYFNETKDAFVHLSGYSRLYTYFSEDTASKLTMPYFRFYLDGQKDSRWAFHTRFDINSSFSNTAGGRTTGLYFARAYTTYKYNDAFSIDAGRNINFLHKYDVLTYAELEVGLGVAPQLKLGNLTLAGSFLYLDASQRSAPADEPENIYYGARAGYEHSFGTDFKLSYGLGWQDTDRGTGFVQWTPDLTIQLPYSIWIVDQFLFINQALDTQENYLEIGKDITSKLSIDSYLHSTKANEAKTTHAVGVEYYYRFNPAFMVALITEIGDAFAENARNRKYNVTSIVEYKF